VRVAHLAVGQEPAALAEEEMAGTGPTRANARRIGRTDFLTKVEILDNLGLSIAY